MLTLSAVLFTLATSGPSAPTGVFESAYAPGARSLLSAHNCYPYHGLWGSRIDQVLETPLPLSIEQDLCWAWDPKAGEHRSMVAHNGPFTGDEPTLTGHFFDRIRPIAEAALRRAQHDPSEKQRWPLIVLDLDVKDDTLEHARAIRAELMSHLAWLTTAPRNERIGLAEPLDLGPVMVNISGSANQKRVFHDELEPGEPIIAFGRCQVRAPITKGLNKAQAAQAKVEYPATMMVTEPADNFRRWWNNSWHVIETGGPTKSGDWTPEENDRLIEIVDYAHKMGYFVRFYTINGHSKAQAAAQGYGGSYNTGSLEAAQIRWRAEIEAGVDLIATDQYTEFAQYRAGLDTEPGADEGDQ